MCPSCTIEKVEPIQRSLFQVRNSKILVVQKNAVTTIHVGKLKLDLKGPGTGKQTNPPRCKTCKLIRLLPAETHLDGHHSIYTNIRKFNESL